MKITHAIRGEEWLPSAPAHILIYRFLGWEKDMPHYAHLPLLLKPDGNGKLSKRDGDRLGFPVFPLEWCDPSSKEISSGYREKGYYPEAFVNMLAFLGWNPGTEQEIFTVEELANAFSFEHIHKAGAKFDPEKAKWFNEHYLRSRSTSSIAQHLKASVMNTFGLSESDRRVSTSFLETAVDLLKPRVQFEHEMLTVGAYLFSAPNEYDMSVVQKKWKPELGGFYTAFGEALSKVEDLTAAHAESTFKETAAASNIKPGDVLQLLRVLISGQGGGVDMFGMIALLGKEEMVQRLDRGLKAIQA
jgi:glutamyl-tRNA synthetase